MPWPKDGAPCPYTKVASDQHSRAMNIDGRRDKVMSIHQLSKAHMLHVLYFLSLLLYLAPFVPFAIVAWRRPSKLSKVLLIVTVTIQALAWAPYHAPGGAQTNPLVWPFLSGTLMWIVGVIYLGYAFDPRRRGDLQS